MPSSSVPPRPSGIDHVCKVLRQAQDREGLESAHRGLARGRVGKLAERRIEGRPNEIFAGIDLKVAEQANEIVFGRREEAP